MRTDDISSNEMSGQRNVSSANTLVQCDSYATAVSIKEMEEVVMACGIPMTKLSYLVYDRDENMVKEGFYEFPAEGVNRFVRKDVLIELDGKRDAYRNMEFFRKGAKISCQLLNGELLEVAQ